MNRNLPRILMIAVLLFGLTLALYLLSLGKGTAWSAPDSEEGFLFSLPKYQTEVYRGFEDVAAPLAPSPVAERFRVYPDIAVNGITVSRHMELTVIENVIYVAALPVLRVLVPMADVTRTADGGTEVKDKGFHCSIKVGEPYFQLNDQYFYVSHRVQAGRKGPLLPLWTLADAMGCTIRQDEVTGHIALRQVCPVFSSYLYNEEDLYWLSHIIYAESGNQDMPGRVAVGTVVMNRLRNAAFPNSIKEIVLQEGQFSPVDNGTIYLEPDEWSVIAAKICLTGQREAGDSLFFNVSSLRSWAYYNRPYVCTIGGHSFFL